MLEQTTTQRGVMSLTCSDVRVSDRTESPIAPRTAHVHAGLARRNRTSGIVGTKSHNGHHQQKSLCFVNFKEKRFVGRLQLHREGDKWGRFRFGFDVPCPVKGLGGVLKGNILVQSAFALRSPAGKQKLRCRFCVCSTIRFLETAQGQIPRRPRQARVLLGHPLEQR